MDHAVGTVKILLLALTVAEVRIAPVLRSVWVQALPARRRRFPKLGWEEEPCRLSRLDQLQCEWKHPANDS
jgi:hypothetical protein